MCLIGLLMRQTRDSLYTIIVSLAWIMLTGAFFYYTYKLTDLTIFLSVASLPLAMRFLKLPEAKIERKNGLIISLLSLTLFGIIIWLLLKNQTSEAIISPWPQVGPLVYVLLAAIIALGFIHQSSLSIGLIFIALSSIALLVYKNGFGFDSFTHQAAEIYIKLHGTITPKTFYYIGHYALIVAVHSLSGISIHLLDAYLVPVFSMPLLGMLLYRSLGKYAAFFLLLPFGFFTLTTPFSFALVLLAVLLVLQMQNAPEQLRWLLAFAILSIHPIVGVPALLSNLYFYKKLETTNYANTSASRFPYDKNKTEHRDKFLIAIASAIALPILFLMVGKFTPHWPNISWPIVFDRRYDFWLDIIHLFEIVITPTLIIMGIIISAKRYRSHLILFFAFLLSGLLSKFFITFPSIISYEQDSFADRIIFLSLFFIFIPLLFWLKEQIARIKFTSRLSRGLFFATLSLAILFSAYISYPRKDVYSISKGWSVGAADFAAVEKIEADAQNAPYIVLANQATSAAALQKFGFRYIKSSNDEFFFYPIPTSGQLYQYYLDIVYNNRGRMALLDALQYAGVSQGYFAISNYWWDATKIKNSAKLWADSWFDADDGKVTVFKVKK